MADSTVDTLKGRGRRVDDAMEDMEAGSAPVAAEKASAPKGEAGPVKGQPWYAAFTKPTTQPVNRRNKRGTEE